MISITSSRKETQIISQSIRQGNNSYVYIYTKNKQLETENSCKFMHKRIPNPKIGFLVHFKILTLQGWAL